MRRSVGGVRRLSPVFSVTALLGGGTMFRYILSGWLVAIALIANPGSVQAQQTSDSDYIGKIMPAAPAGVVQGATIVQMQNGGGMRTVQAGTNGFTCMLVDPKTP